MQVDPAMIAIDAEAAYETGLPTASAVRERTVISPDGTQAREIISIPIQTGSPPRRLEQENELLQQRLALVQHEANAALQQQRAGFEQAATA